ncbi:MAG TPA: hypothetical protein VNU44_07610 [Bryobacteraceae bacterium]|jgi:hypothetical protein|nr:hypothetical protein [Bryobacteraceae bacterium]
MKRLLGIVLLLGVELTAQTKSVQSILLALKDSNAPRKALSDQLVNKMMATAKRDVSRQLIERFSEDFTGALLGRDITTVRASVMQRAISDLLSGKGSNFEPASKLRDTLTSCGISAPTVQAIVGRFIDIGQEIRGPDDLGVLPKTLK